MPIDGTAYRVSEHPSAPGMPYAQEGRQAVVYQLRTEDGGRKALKVFKPRFRVPSLVSLADKLAPFADLPGLTVCQRMVLSARRHADLLRQYPDLTYAVLMPWIEGPSWTEVMLSGRTLSPAECLSLARTLADMLAGLEERGLAHCDLSGSNVLLPMLAGGSGIELVDVEQMYGSELSRPALLPGGSPGYGHRTGREGVWSPNADRFAGALLITEMLAWSDEQVREAAWGESCFDPDELQEDCERYRAMAVALRQRWGAKVASLLDQVWHSEALAECPTFGEWLVALPVSVPEGADTTDRQKHERRVELAGASEDRQREAGYPDADSDDRLARLFAEGVAAYERSAWAQAQELLAEVVRLAPEYQEGQWQARALLAEVRQQLAGPGPKPRPSALVWGLAALAALLLLAALIVPERAPLHAWVFGATPAPTAAPAGTPLPVAVVTTVVPSSPPTLPPSDTPTATVTDTPAPAATHTPTATWTVTATATITPTITPTPRPAFTVANASVNVREGPGTIYPVIGALRAGQTFIITGRNEAGDWWQFDYTGQAGWVSNSVVDSNDRAASAVVVIAPPTPKVVTALARGSVYTWNAEERTMNRISVDRSPYESAVLFSLRELSDPVSIVEISPDGHLVTLGAGQIITECPGKWKSWSSYLHIMNIDGGGLHPVQNGTKRGGSWSPDGNRIITSLERMDKDSCRRWNHLQIIDLNGNVLVEFSPGALSIGGPAWSPDGQWIVASRIDGAGGYGLWLWPASGDGEARRLTEDIGAMNAVWAPDSQRIAFVSGGGISEVQLGSTSVRRLLDVGLSPVYSPSGKWLAYCDDSDSQSVTSIVALDGTLGSAAIGPGCPVAWRQ